MVDIDIPTTVISGNFDAVTVDANGAPPSDVIRLSDQFSIDCTWYIEGPFASALSGNWHVRAAFESVGPGPEFFTDEVLVPLDGRTGPGAPGPGGPPYTAQFVFPAGSDFPGPGPRPKIQPEGIGVYKVAVILTYTDSWGNQVPIAASVDLKQLTIFDD